MLSATHPISCLAKTTAHFLTYLCCWCIQSSLELGDYMYPRQGRWNRTNYSSFGFIKTSLKQINFWEHQKVRQKKTYLTNYGYLMSDIQCTMCNFVKLGATFVIWLMSLFFSLSIYNIKAKCLIFCWPLLIAQLGYIN